MPSPSADRAFSSTAPLKAGPFAGVGPIRLLRRRPMTADPLAPLPSICTGWHNATGDS